MTKKLAPPETPKRARRLKADPSSIVIKRRKDRSILYEIDRVNRTGTYYVNSESSQTKFINEINLAGFRTFPRTFYPSGFGFRVSGNQLLQELHDKFGARLRISLTPTGPSSIKRGKNIVRVTLNEALLIQANRVVSGIKREKFNEIRTVVGEYLNKEFPGTFQQTNTGLLDYKPNTIADFLEDESVIAALSERDENALKLIYPQLIDATTFSLRSNKQVRIISEGIKTSQKVYLERTIAEFKKKMDKSLAEGTWQTFLRQHILTLLNIYAFVIEKQSVQLDGKYPDFMLIDAYGYLDIYEIKKPQTPLVKYDKSRSNYYWDKELARAIIQTEKYISHVERNRFELENKLKKLGSDARIVRPQGYIIAGKRADLTEDMQEDFRTLNDSLKNVDIICFDDLLDNLIALQMRLTTDADS